MSLIQVDNDPVFAQLYQYYKYLFPYELIIQWLSYPTDNLSQEQLFRQSSELYMRNRELSYELNFELNNNFTSIPKRYQSISKPMELRNAILGQSNHKKEESYVTKIDIGAVYEKKPLKGSDNKPMEKEFVIDIDMSDYNDSRTCCQGKKICPLCWKFLRVACEVLYQTLTEDFGYEHILWIFSGGRGIHLWVCDESARKLSDSARKAILTYLSLCKGGKKSLKQNLKKIGNHPVIERAINISKDYFEEIICKDQDLFSREENRKSLIEHIETFDKEFAKKLEQKWNMLLKDGANSKVLWRELKQLKFQEFDVKKNKQSHSIENLENELILIYLYPRLDEAVSTTMNHLLKSPFCIHPSSKRVCVPFTYENFKNFDPFKVPTLDDLIQELNLIKPDVQPQAEDVYVNLGPQMNSLKKHLEIFEKFLKNYSEKQESKRLFEEKVLNNSNQTMQEEF